MQSLNRPVVTTLRLSRARHRQLKLAAAARGASLQRALEQALDLWLFSPEPGAGARRRSRSVRGILKGVDVHALRRKERARELDRDARLLRS